MKFLRAALEQVADFGQEFFLRGRFGWQRGFRFFVALERVHAFDQQKNAERHDEKIQRDGQEIAPCENRPGLQRIGQRQMLAGGFFLRLQNLFGQRKVKVGEINVADKSGDGRHDDVLHQRIDDVAKCRADDDADGEVGDIAAQRKFPELMQDGYFHRIFF